MPKKNIALHYVKLRIPKIYCIGWEVPSFRFYLTTEQKKNNKKAEFIFMFIPFTITENTYWNVSPTLWRNSYN